ncbi:MAG: hypothetical protein JHC94_04600, partial [Acidimicrobiia bacterium]|nr:hypothetical protein [Acidimicrobiia bacterium]
MNDRFEGDELGISKEAPLSGSDGVRIIAPEEARLVVEAGLAEGHAVEVDEDPESPSSLGLLFPPAGESSHPTASVRSITPPPRLVPTEAAPETGQSSSEGVRIVGATAAGEATGEVPAVFTPSLTQQASSEEV